MRQATAVILAMLTETRGVLPDIDMPYPVRRLLFNEVAPADDGGSRRSRTARNG